MVDAQDRLNIVRETIAEAASAAGRQPSDVRLVAVSKTFDADAIRPVLQAGQRVFGENRVQESQGKWPGLRKEFGDVELHLIGPLQSNKAADAVALFDVIETIDRPKIAREIAKEMKTQSRHPRLYVQVNIGEEDQKAGIAPDKTTAFVQTCRTEHGLTIDGLMCIPPIDDDPAPHFRRLAVLAKECGVATLSMGMSGDYETAIAEGATEIRVGSAIFGSRDG